MNARFLFRCLALACWVSPAFAHAFLDHAVPGAGQTVSPPKQITLIFTEALEPAFSGATVMDAQDHDVTAGRADIAGETMTVTLKALVPGTYRVTWHVVSVDTHRTQGSYKFTVRP